MGRLAIVVALSAVTALVTGGREAAATLVDSEMFYFTPTPSNIVTSGGEVLNLAGNFTNFGPNAFLFPDTTYAIFSGSGANLYDAGQGVVLSPLFVYAETALHLLRMKARHSVPVRVFPYKLAI